MDRLGDNNKNVKAKAEQIAMALANHDLGGPSFIIAHILKA